MRILIIVEPDRKDWYHYLKSDKNSRYILLWHESQNDIPDWVKDEPFFSEVYVWTSFTTPGQLINKIKPDRIVFFEIIDQRQIALMVTANNKGIKTFYLEHGAAGNKEAAIKRSNEKDFFRQKKSHYLLQRMKSAFWKMLKSKIFYYSAISKVELFDSLVKYIKLPFAMLFNTPNKVLSNILFVERTPYRSIVFNKPNFEQFQVYTGIAEDKALFTGVPIFDNYFFEKDTTGDHVSYIDHPYLEQGMLNWTPEYHRQIANHLFQFAETKRVKILVKLHPASDMDLWKQYKFDNSVIEIVQSGDFTKQLLKSKLILSYSSSMVNGFLCAQKNVVLLGWHPEPGIFGADFSKSGLCHVSLSPSELDSKFDYWISNNLSKNNETAYQEFLKEFNFPFDGQAAERVLRAITSDEIS